MKYLLLVLGTLLMPAAGAAPCPPDSLVVKDLMLMQGKRVTVMGNLVNKCDAPAGAKVRFTFYDAKDAAVKVHEAWPANSANIPARKDFPFDFPVDGIAGAKRVEAKVIEAKTW